MYGAHENQGIFRIDGARLFGAEAFSEGLCLVARELCKFFRRMAAVSRSAEIENHMFFLFESFCGDAPRIYLLNKI